jgi:site-specific recombinase XerD
MNHPETIFGDCRNETITLPDHSRGNPTGQAVEGAAIDAQTDAEAAALWLRAKGGRSANTFDSYRREALRLLLWLGEQRLSLSELKVEHVHLYYAHLANPPTRWIRPRKPHHDETLLPTQVLAGPLSNKSIDYSRRVLGQMCSYLQDAGYLQHNAFRLSVKPPIIVETIPTRLLDLDSWNWLWNWILALPCDKPSNAAHAARVRWLIALLYHTGIRREEAAHGRMGDFMRRDRAWSLRVVSKGHKEKLVTVNSMLLRELIRYRSSLNLPNYPVPGEETPLVVSVNAGRRNNPLTPRAIGLLINTVGRRAAGECADEHCCAQIARMSTHWMRHTNATHRLLAGASLETTQDELGHADPRTTRIYAKVSDVRRKEDAEKLASLSNQPLYGGAK